MNNFAQRGHLANAYNLHDWFSMGKGNLMSSKYIFEAFWNAKLLLIPINGKMIYNFIKELKPKLDSIENKWNGKLIRKKSSFFHKNDCSGKLIKYSDRKFQFENHCCNLVFYPRE